MNEPDIHLNNSPHIFMTMVHCIVRIAEGVYFEEDELHVRCVVGKPDFRARDYLLIGIAE